MKIGRMFMFGYRSDGRKIKNIPPFFKIIPQVMRTRSDSQVYYTYDMPIKEIDNYIDKNNQMMYNGRKNRKGHSRSAKEVRGKDDRKRVHADFVSVSVLRLCT